MGTTKHLHIACSDHASCFITKQHISTEESLYDLSFFIVQTHISEASVILEF